MKELNEFLSEREIYVLENHPAKTYAAIAAELGVTQERVRQIKVAAERKVREEKWNEERDERGREPVSLNVTRSEVFLIQRALMSYQTFLLRTGPADQRRKNTEADPDLTRTMDLLQKIQNMDK